MTEQIQSSEEAGVTEISPVKRVEAVEGSEVSQEPKKNSLKGMLMMALCCGAPLLLILAIPLFGLSLDREVVFLGIDIQDTEQDARTFLKKFGITYLNAQDASGEVAIEYGVWGIPETFFIDRKGRITYKQVGALGWPIITAKLDEALRGTVSAQEGRGDYRPIR